MHELPRGHHMFARGRRSPQAVFAPLWVSVRGCKCTHGNADAETHTTFRQRHRYRKRRRARDIQAETHTTHTVTVVANGVLTDTDTQRHIVTPDIETDTHTTHTVIVVTNSVLRVVIGIDPVQPGLGTHAQKT